MKQSSKFSLVIVSLFLWMTISACSLNEAWKNDSNFISACYPADNAHPKGYCEEGYFCFADHRCYANSSLTLGEACLEDFQCQSNLVCSQDVLQCAKECNNYFETTNCPANTICAPLYQINEDNYNFLNTGACQGSCPLPGTESKSSKKCGYQTPDCVKVAENISLCFKKCTYSHNSYGEYSDNLSESLTCHPVGPNNEPTMVAMKAGIKIANEACDPVTNPCEKGLVCIKGAGSSLMCHKLCGASNDPENDDGCDTDQECVSVPGYRFCSVVGGN